MKYLLVENGESNDPNIVRIFNTPQERITATREAIMGPNNEGIECPDLEVLADEGQVDYEGDPSLRWIDAEVDDHTK